jgi:hypothetical protein
MTETTPKKARRGDLIVVHTHQRELGGYDHFRVGVVTNITRDGLVKKVQIDGNCAPIPLDCVGVDIRAYWIQPQDEIDVQAALATAATNPWTHNADLKGKPYDTLDEVKAALRPHLTK